MPWTVTLANANDLTVDVSAHYAEGDTSFSWNSTIRRGEDAAFVACAKKECDRFIAAHKDDRALQTSLEALLNG